MKNTNYITSELSPDRISEEFHNGFKAPVTVFDEIDSTSTEARRRYCDGARGLHLYVANRQTAGRGRQGKSFYSPADSGLYMTLLLPIDRAPRDVTSLTVAAAVAVRRAILINTGVKTEIKWVNDLLLNGKKVAGILAEALYGGDGESALLIGIGINLTTADFPDDIKSVAGAVASSAGSAVIDRNRLAASVAEELYRLTVGRNFSLTGLIDEYRSASAVIGNNITVIENNRENTALAEAVEDDGALRVRFDDGTVRLLRSGEISIRRV